ncbi:MAG: thermonuclease family protein [Patescibacteria group bacterium]
MKSATIPPFLFHAERAGYNESVNTRTLTLIASLIGLGIIISFASSPPLQSSGPVASQERAEPPAVTPTTIDSDEWYKVVRVVDGDTLVVEIDGANVTVRLIGLDTPETVDPRKPVQCFGKEASDEAKQGFGVGYVRLETDPSQGTYDKYGRLLAYVYVPASSKQEGILINEYMIAKGYGHEYTYNLPYKYQTEFKAAEKEARENKKGLWADGVCPS